MMIVEEGVVVWALPDFLLGAVAKKRGTENVEVGNHTEVLESEQLKGFLVDTRGVAVDIV